jgi:hypothetical protein
MQVEFSPIVGVMFGVGYAYYEPTPQYKGMHLIQVACGLILIQITWAE